MKYKNEICKLIWCLFSFKALYEFFEQYWNTGLPLGSKTRSFYSNQCLQDNSADGVNSFQSVLELGKSFC